MTLDNFKFLHLSNTFFKIFDSFMSFENSEKNPIYFWKYYGEHSSIKLQKYLVHFLIKVE